MVRVMKFISALLPHDVSFPVEQQQGLSRKLSVCQENSAHAKLLLNPVAPVTTGLPITTQQAAHPLGSAISLS